MKLTAGSKRIICDCCARCVFFLATLNFHDNPDQEALRNHVHLLPALSAERVAAELRRLMAGPAAIAVPRKVADMGIDQILFGTPFNTAIMSSELLAKLWWDLDFARRLACCLPAGMRALGAERLKLGRSEQRFLARADGPVDSAVAAGLLGPNWTRSAYSLGDVAFIYALQAACSERSDYSSGQQVEDQVAQLRQIVFFKPPACPVSGRDVEQRFGYSGPKIGACLDYLGNLWAELISQHLGTASGPFSSRRSFQKECDDKDTVSGIVR